ncbi:MAG: ribosomal protein S18-alanine N-acetyltransferase [Pseudomonadota bacterium]
MNARLRPEGSTAPVDQLAYALRPMTPADLDAVERIEQAVYDFPWSRGNFADSLTAQYHAQVLTDATDTVCGYFVAMPGVEEMHLLNIAVAKTAQGQGLSLLMLDAVALLSRADGALLLWLEVRPSNVHAVRIYERYGFYPIARRRDYYPSLDTQGRACREDALVMSAQVVELLQRRGLRPD